MFSFSPEVKEKLSIIWSETITLVSLCCILYVEILCYMVARRMKPLSQEHEANPF